MEQGIFFFFFWFSVRIGNRSSGRDWRTTHTNRKCSILGGFVLFLYNPKLNSPLAFDTGHEAVARLLIQNGADINVINTCGNSVLNLAARKGILSHLIIYRMKLYWWKNSFRSRKSCSIADSKRIRCKCYEPMWKFSVDFFGCKR